MVLLTMIYQPDHDLLINAVAIDLFFVIALISC